jgi:hypothetical protein
LGALTIIKSAIQYSRGELYPHGSGSIHRGALPGVWPKCALAPGTQGVALGNPGSMVELDGEALRQKRVAATREAGAEQPGATGKTARVAAPSVTLIVFLCSVASFGPGRLIGGYGVRQTLTARLSL